jgi:hypothetical protein
VCGVEVVQLQLRRCHGSGGRIQDGGRHGSSGVQVKEV